MSTNIIISGEGAKARGRNGFFIPREIDLGSEPDGAIAMRVYSKALGDSAPIMLSLSRADWRTIAEAVDGIQPRGEIAHFKSGDQVRVKRNGKILTIENYFGAKFNPPYTVIEEPSLYSHEDLEAVSL